MNGLKITELQDDRRIQQDLEVRKLGGKDTTDF